MEDGEAFFRLFGDPLVRHWLVLQDEAARSDTDELLAATLTNHAGYPAPCGCWAVVSPDEGGICGIALLRPLKQDHSLMEIGWAIESLHWGKGYATEAMACVCDLALEHFEAIHAVIRPENFRSLRVADKLGLTRVEHDFDFEGGALLLRRERTP